MIWYLPGRSYSWCGVWGKFCIAPVKRLPISGVWLQLYICNKRDNNRSARYFTCNLFSVDFFYVCCFPLVLNKPAFYTHWLEVTGGVEYRWDINVEWARTVWKWHYHPTDLLFQHSAADGDEELGSISVLDLYLIASPPFYVFLWWISLVWLFFLLLYTHGKLRSNLLLKKLLQFGLNCEK